MDWIAAFIIIGIAGALGNQRSTFLVDFVVIVYVFNRGLLVVAGLPGRRVQSFLSD